MIPTDDGLPIGIIEQTEILYQPYYELPLR
jgi:hypothetical protein